MKKHIHKYVEWSEEHPVQNVTVVAGVVTGMFLFGHMVGTTKVLKEMQEQIKVIDQNAYNAWSEAERALSVAVDIAEHLNVKGFEQIGDMA